MPRKTISRLINNVFRRFRKSGLPVCTDGLLFYSTNLTIVTDDDGKQFYENSYTEIVQYISWTLASLGWVGNRSIDMIGADNRPFLSGSYIKANFDTTFSTNVLVGDVIAAITDGATIGTITINGQIDTVEDEEYSGFIVTRAGAEIGRFNVSESTGTTLINQFRGANALDNIVIAGNTVDLWGFTAKYKNAVNNEGYAVADGLTMYAETGQVNLLDEGVIIPVDLSNTSKVLAYNASSIQIDSDYIGAAKRSLLISEQPAFFFNADRTCPLTNLDFPNFVHTTYKTTVYFSTGSDITSFGNIFGTSEAIGANRLSIYILNGVLTFHYGDNAVEVEVQANRDYKIVCSVVAGEQTAELMESVTERLCCSSTRTTTSVPNFTALTSRWIGSVGGRNFFSGTISLIEEEVDGVLFNHYYLGVLGSIVYNLKKEKEHVVTGTLTSLNTTSAHGGDVMYRNGFVKYSDGATAPRFDSGNVIDRSPATADTIVTTSNSIDKRLDDIYKYSQPEDYDLLGSAPEFFDINGNAVAKTVTEIETVAGSNTKVSIETIDANTYENLKIAE